MDFLPVLALDGRVQAVLRTQDEGGMEAVHPRARRDHRLAPVDRSEEATEMAGIGCSAVLCQPGVVTCLVADGAHDISAIEAAGRPVRQLELTARNQLAVPGAALER